MEDPPRKDDSPRVLRVLEALKQASHELQSNPTSPTSEDSRSSAIKALLDLESDSHSILSQDPNLTALSEHLHDLKSLVESLQKARGYSLRSFLTRRVSAHSISRVAGSIETEIQAWIDRESVETLGKALSDQNERQHEDEDELVMVLAHFAARVSEGFNRELQDLVLRFKIFNLLGSILFDSEQTLRIRENAAFCIASLIRFNKDVFVGEVVMGLTIRALLTMHTTCAMKVLCSLIKSIKSAFVDEIVSNGEIRSIISSLDMEDIELRVVSLDCVLEIGYYGRKEAIEAMLEHGLVRKLVVMQRSKLGGDLIEVAVSKVEEGANDNANSNNSLKRQSTGKYLENHPFASCVARFAVQLEVGEGLRQREKRAFKQEILDRVREASMNDAEAATIVAEVLWGSSP